MGPDFLEQFHLHLVKTDDPILVILKAHLLVEQRLRDILTRIFRVSNELKAASLSFYQALCLCRAIIGREEDPAWDFIDRLNEARNRIGHQLDLGDFDGLLGSIVVKLREDYASHLETALYRFRAAVLYTCGYLDAIRYGICLHKAYDSEGKL
jgi:hypothetical protein